MKNTLKSLIFTFTLIFMSFSASAGVVVGDNAPDFKFKGLQGEEVSLSELRGKIVVLEWTNHQCPFVEKHYDTNNMQSLQKKYHEDEEVVWITINSSAKEKQGYHESDEKMLEILSSKQAMPNYIVRDVSGQIGKSYHAATTPHMFVIDKEGVLQYMGAIDSIPSASKEDVEKAENYVLKAVESLKNGEEIKVVNTTPYGCSVKY